MNKKYLPEKVVDWVRTQKRVTNGLLRKQFEVDENEADTIYSALKSSGYIGPMGYVIQKELEEEE